MSQLELEKIGEKANAAIEAMGLIKTNAVIAEGFCPLCLIRSGPDIFSDYDSDDEQPVEAVVNCSQCLTRWRTGPNPDHPTVPVWVEHTREWRVEGEHQGYLTMRLNPPDDPPDEREEEWEEEWT